MYFRRKIDSFLDNWRRQPDRLPLIVKGARQIGKTESIRRFAAGYGHVIEINFYEEPKYKSICSEGYSVDLICKNISRLDPGKKFISGDTLIFFDEITDYPEIATSLKFFAQDGRYDVICSGSLSGTHYKRIESNSVGYKTDYLMYSMDFEEFLWARGYGDDVIEDIYSHMSALMPFGETDMEVFRSLFLDYATLGGMPAVVRQYIRTGTFEGTLELQRQLIADYKEDIRKYADGLEQTRILNTFNSIAPQLAKENKKFQFGKVAAGARYRDYIGCVEWLNDAGIVNLCYCLHYPELPLKGNTDAEKFKVYFADTGLLIAQMDEETQEDLRANRNLGTYKGAIYENLIGEALVKSGRELYYYKKEDSQLEEDFFVRDRTGLVPLEVKANKGRTATLRALIGNERYPDIRYGIKLTGGNVGYNDNIYTFPYFCGFLIQRWLKDPKRKTSIEE